MPTRKSARRLLAANSLLFTILAAAALVGAGSAQAASFNVLFTYCGVGCDPDGEGPYGGLIEDSAGNLYGTTTSGGQSNEGVVFELSGSQYTVLYSFCQKKSCADGEYPEAPVIVDTNGNLYGTTSAGGAYNNGIAFELKKQQPSYAFKVLHDFCNSTCSDGGNPSVGLTYAGANAGEPYDGMSTLYGATASGGSLGGGTAYSLSPPRPGSKRWQLKPIFQFCDRPACQVGNMPSGNLILDSSGNIFGTTYLGGSDGGGEVFELVHAGRKWKETAIYSFCNLVTCPDGNEPESLALDASGNLYGTTASAGGSPNCTYTQGCGVLFQLTNSGGAWQYSVLYTFCSKTNCTDGYAPNGALSISAAGTLYGSAAEGGSYAVVQQGGGVLFQFANGKYKVLHDFCTTDCSDGAGPNSTMIDPSGTLFGTTGGGQPGGVAGAIYEYRP